MIGSIALPNGSRPWAAAYDPSNKDIYVTDLAHPAVYLIHNLTRIHVVRSSSFTGGTWSIAWDPSAKLMLCVNLHGLLVGINGTSISGSIHVGSSYSEGMAFDSRANEVLITIYAKNNVAGVNASHPFSGPQLNIRVGKFPVGIASDPATGYDYVTNFRGNSVDVINGSGGSLGTIPVGNGPDGVSIDTAKHEVFVANHYSNNVSVISGLSAVRTLAFTPPNNYLTGVVYDPATKLVYVTALNYKVFIVT
ncbi:MAG TPA: YncE family protein [Thermoplasmata archaeon]|nr:YncE family protein [Thermoplasmata archaeon]